MRTQVSRSRFVDMPWAGRSIASADFRCGVLGAAPARESERPRPTRACLSVVDEQRDEHWYLEFEEVFAAEMTAVGEVIASAQSPEDSDLLQRTRARLGKAADRASSFMFLNGKNATVLEIIAAGEVRVRNAARSGRTRLRPVEED